MRELDVDTDATKTTASNSPMAAAAADILRRRELPEVEEGSSGVASAMGALDFLHEWINYAGSFREEAQWQPNAALMLPTPASRSTKPTAPMLQHHQRARACAGRMPAKRDALVSFFGVRVWL